MLFGIVFAMTFLRTITKSQAPLSLAQEFDLATKDGVTILFASGPNAGETYVTLENGKALYSYVESSLPGEPSKSEKKQGTYQLVDNSLKLILNEGSEALTFTLMAPLDPILSEHPEAKYMFVNDSLTIGISPAPEK